MKTTRDIIEVEQAIINLTRAIGGEPIEETVGPDFEKWWVVAVGDSFDEASFDQREAARERLRRFLASRGVRMPEWVWVYDEESRAKVILAQCVSEEESERLAGVFRAKGICVRIRREFSEDGGLPDVSGEPGGSGDPGDPADPADPDEER